MRRRKAKKRPNRLNIEKRMRAKHNRHEQRKKRKDKNTPQVSTLTGDYMPNIAAMFGLLVARRRRG